MAPYRFVLNARLERATSLLTRTRHSVSEIALHCGFYSPSHFASAFRRVLGTTPGECRRSRGLKLPMGLAGTV
jgi:AraC family transcriptional regulator